MMSVPDVILKAAMILSCVSSCYCIGPCSGLSCVIGCNKPKEHESQGITPTNPRASYSLGEVVQYQCLDGLVPQGGSAISRCLQDGTWSQPTLRCIAEPMIGALGIHQCSPIPEFSHTVHDRGSAGQDTGSIVKYHCEEGYSGVGSGEMSYKCDYYNNGEWALVGEELECKKTCPELNISHGNVEPQGPILANSSLTVTCEQGYLLRGSVLQTCTESGQWTGDTPQCLVVDCGEPIIPNGSCEGTETTYNVILGCSCNPGYYLNGSTNIRCTNLSEWAPSLPICIKDVNISMTTSTFPPIHIEISSNNTMQVQISENGTTLAPNEKRVTVIAIAASIGAYLLLVAVISIGFLVKCMLTKSKQKKKEDQKGNYDQVTQNEETV